MHLAYPSSLQVLLSNTYKEIIQIRHNMIKNPNWQEATIWLFTSVAEDLNSGRPITNPENGGSRTRIRDRRMSSPTRRPPRHAASLNGLEGVFLPSRIDVLLNLSYFLTILSRNRVLFKRFGYFPCSVKSSLVFISVCSMNCAASFEIHFAGFQCHAFQSRSK